jgi:glycosyltransferase involved in cell wall biosynthesis
LSRDFPELRLRLIGATSIAGGGGGEEYVASLKSLAAGLAVELVDPIYDRAALARELQSADYYCYPSLAAQGEALPVAPIEAMATGLPLVVSALPVFRDYVEPEQNGLVFDHESPDPGGNLAAALRRLIEDAQLRLRLGQAASETALRFGNEPVADLFLQDFQSLLDRAK